MGRQKRKTYLMPNNNTLPDAREFIIIRGAKVNNLKNIDLDIPKYKFVVFTGVSGSGKTSIVFDTIYAEGQRRYVESLSSYARQFLEKMNKPDVELIEGLAPSMAIEQRTGTRNSRSTVGTSTEIYDYLRLLFGRVGTIYSPISNLPVNKDTTESIISEILDLKAGKLIIYCTSKYFSEKEVKSFTNILRQKGFYKLIVDEEIADLNDFNENEILAKLKSKKKKDVYEINFIVDRLILDSKDNESISRLNDAIEMAFKEGNGYITIRILKEDKAPEDIYYNSYLERDGIKFEEPEPRLFSFNNPYGACKKCQGFSKTMDIDMNLVIPDRRKSIFDGAIVPFTTPKHSKFLKDLAGESRPNRIDLFKPFNSLTKEEKDIVFNGTGKYIGIKGFFKMVEREASYKLHYRVLLNKYRSYTTCSECGGSRLRKEALYVKIAGKNIFDIVRMKIDDALDFFRSIKLKDYEKKVASRILEEIISRLNYLNEVGLSYLTLDRFSFTLSGGEAQRINLSTSLGSSLVGSIYVLDEPTIGLHAADNAKLIKIMKSLRDLGNTVLVVEHDKDMMKEADMIVDMGPYAGAIGGEVMFKGTYNEIIRSNKSLTGKYLSKKETIPVPKKRKILTKNSAIISVSGITENNLKNINVNIPLNSFVCITGVSGSGKSTLVESIINPAVKRILEGPHSIDTGEFEEISGVENIDAIEMVNQNAIGKSSRSNPVTYIKAFDEIREAFSHTVLAKKKGFTSGSFSFNVPGGRCDDCEGTGNVKIEMQFMADIFLECELCGGKRYKSEILEVKIKGSDGSHKNISDVFDMTVSQALEFFKSFPKIIKRLQYLDFVGLGYIKLGQSGTTLSGGEAQRVKLAYHLAFQEANMKTLFIFDEPTTGLHYYDIAKLIKCFNELINKGNSVLVVEHNLEVIKCADYVIDLGPGSGDAGGYLVAEGTPEEIKQNPASITGKYLEL